YASTITSARRQGRCPRSEMRQQAEEGRWGGDRALAEKSAEPGVETPSRPIDERQFRRTIDALVRTVERLGVVVPERATRGILVFGSLQLFEHADDFGVGSVHRQEQRMVHTVTDCVTPGECGKRFRSPAPTGSGR